MIEPRYNIFASEAKWQKIWGLTPQPHDEISLKNLRKSILDDVLNRYPKNTCLGGGEITAPILGFLEDDNIKDIIESYGYDVLRFFIFDSDPDKDFIWSDDNLDGAWRFVKKTWAQVIENIDCLPPIGTSILSLSASGTNLRHTTHNTITGFTRTLAKADYNLCVARLRELSNAIGKLKVEINHDYWALREALEALTQLMAPITPHLSAECWSILGYDTDIQNQPWPNIDLTIINENDLKIAVQINGKLRGIISVPTNANNALIEQAALNDQKIKKFLGDRSIQTPIIVPNKLINIVTDK